MLLCRFVFCPSSKNMDKSMEYTQNDELKEVRKCFERGKRTKAQVGIVTRPLRSLNTNIYN